MTLPLGDAETGALGEQLAAPCWQRLSLSGAGASCSDTGLRQYDACMWWCSNVPFVSKNCSCLSHIANIIYVLMGLGDVYGVEGILYENVRMVLKRYLFCWKCEYYKRHCHSSWIISRQCSWCAYYGFCYELVSLTIHTLLGTYRIHCLVFLIVSYFCNWLTIHLTIRGEQGLLLIYAWTPIQEIMWPLHLVKNIWTYVWRLVYC